MDHTAGLIIATPGKHERRVALGIALAALLAVLAMAPFGRTPAGASSTIVTLVYTAYVAAVSLTAFLLRHQFRLLRFVPLAVLAIAHAYGALIVAAYLLTFPHVFSRNGLLGAGPQTAAWLWVSAHAGFICLALLYVFAERVHGQCDARHSARPFVAACAAAALAAAAAAIAVATLEQARLPVLVVNDVTFTPLLIRRIVPSLAIAYIGTMCVLAWQTRLRTVTTLWVAVVLVSLCCELTSGTLIAGARFTSGWYLGCAEGAVAAMTFLVVMLRQVNDTLMEFAIINRRLAERSVRDHLTELLNRRGFDDCIAELFRHMRRRPMTLTLLMVDIDHFKRYNDEFGHIHGDEALRAIANAIDEATNRAHDSCCRIGGDEFAVVLPATDEEGGLIVADRIQRAVAALKMEHAPRIETQVVTVSVGVASTERTPECDARGLHARADIALYEAKRLGRNRVAAYSRIDPVRAARALLAS